jgi:hypothetical protein
MEENDGFESIQGGLMILMLYAQSQRTDSWRFEPIVRKQPMLRACYARERTPLRHEATREGAMHGIYDDC